MIKNKKQSYIVTQNSKQLCLSLIQSVIPMSLDDIHETFLSVNMVLVHPLMIRKHGVDTPFTVFMNVRTFTVQYLQCINNQQYGGNEGIT